VSVLNGAWLRLKSLQINVIHEFENGRGFSLRVLSAGKPRQGEIKKASAAAKATIADAF
jgi:hypothetical protein